ncbi:hypothetical protein JTE90_009661 [Oedothorax gibbosus]|uniref:Uncharacterized protein n=1 Tax=Oedothorax gibbosus TaxID=931172 RepID=A0AAV6TWY9_9ARAC|nr:hypothetical protein JTE90_009661 [Oedothorax gibbosus]
MTKVTATLPLKTELESRENSAFLLRNARRNGDGSQKMYYNGSRSISKRKVPSQNTQRSAKMQGSCKLEYACTSGMVVSINSTGVKVEHTDSHYGHKPELQFLRLSKQDVEQVVGKLVLGVPTEKILESNRENISVDLKRSDLMTAQDVNNIKKRYNLQVSDGERHPLDTVSIELWVQEAMKSDKAQREAVDFYNDNDFCLMMMNHTSGTCWKPTGPASFVLTAPMA